jgi:hypothetical protein
MGEAVSTFYHSTTRRLLSHPSFQLMGAFISAHGTMAAEAFLIGKVIAYVGEALCLTGRSCGVGSWRGCGLVVFRIGSSSPESGRSHLDSLQSSDGPTFGAVPWLAWSSAVSRQPVVGLGVPSWLRRASTSTVQGHDFLGAAVPWLKMTMMPFRSVWIFCH